MHTTKWIITILSIFYIASQAKCLPDALQNLNNKIKPIKLAEGTWESSLVNNNIIKILAEEKMGVPVESVKFANGLEMWKKLSNKELDANLEIWPGMVGIQEYLFQNRDIVGIGALGVIAELGWFTQRFVLDQYPQLNKIASLVDPEDASIFNNTIYGIPEWQYYDQDIIRTLKLNISMNYLRSELDLINKVREMTAKQIPMLFHFWLPHYLVDELELSILSMPKINGSIIYPESIIRKVMHHSLKNINPQISFLMQGFTVTSKDMITFTDISHQNNASYAACEWVKNNQNKWKYWITVVQDKSAFLDWSSVGAIVSFSFAILTQVLLIIFLIFIILYREHPFIKASNIKALITLLVGSSVLVSSVYFLFGRATAGSCSAAILVCGIGFSILWGSVLLKEYLIYKIFKRGVKLKKYKLKPQLPIVIYGSVVGIEIVIDLLWILVVPPDTTYDYCAPGNGSWAISLYAFYKIALVFFGSIIAFMAMKFNTPYSESRYLGVGIYCFSIITIVAVVLVNFLPVREAIFILTLGVNVGVISLVTPMYSVKIYRVINTEKNDAIEELKNSVYKLAERHFNSQVRL